MLLHPARRAMSLPTLQSAQPVQARFTHENGTQLRMQCFVTIKDDKGRVALVRVQGIDGWCVPGESMFVNESPDQAAVRVARTWFKTPLGLQLDRILSFPATGGEDDRWYLIFVYHADAPANLQGTDDTEELMFHPLHEPPAKWAMAHGDVWAALQ
jgi:ADP-ribose pyrophosphatase YjhB (NUDIX family)